MNNSGYFSLPRSLTRSQEWYNLSLICQKIFQVLVDHACFRPYQFDDHGHIFELQPGQYCGSYAEIKELCGKEISLIQIERGIKKLILCHFLRQEVRWKKSIITITHKDTYDLIIRGSEVNSEVNLRQTRGKLEVQKKNDNNEKKENIYPTASEVDGHEMAVNGGKIFSLDFNQDLTQSLSKPNNFLITAPSVQHNPGYRTDYQTSENYQTEKTKPKKPRKQKEVNPQALALVEFFYASLEKKVPEAKKGPSETPKLKEESRHFASLFGQYTEEQIKRAINYGHEDSFWKSIIQKPKKLNEHIGKLLTQMSENKIGVPKINQFEENRKIALETKRDWQAKFCEIEVSESKIRFTPTQGTQPVIIVEFSQKGFKDQVQNALEKNCFKKITQTKIS